MLNDFAIILAQPKDVDPAKSIGDLTVRKQAIYVDQFIKVQEDGEDIEFAVSEKYIDHWVKVFGEMQSNGIDVPVPEEHTTKPSARQGTVAAAHKLTDSKGRIGLFYDVEFKDAEAKKTFAMSDVSIFVPPHYTDGKGRTYYRPVLHLALTDYPVVPDLDGWQTIAASLATKGEPKMPLKALAQSLGITVADGADDTAISAAIAKEFKQLKASSNGDPNPMPPKKKKKKPGEEDEPPKFSKGMLSMMSENRSNKIDRLVTANRITPAVATKLKEQYCSDDSCALALSNDGDNSHDGFDSTIAALELNEPVELGEQSGLQLDENEVVLKLGKDDVNPLIADAEARAKANAV